MTSDVDLDDRVRFGGRTGDKWTPVMLRPLILQKFPCGIYHSPQRLFCLKHNAFIFPSSTISRMCRRYSSESGDSKKKFNGTVNIPWWGRLLIVAGVGAGVYYTYCSAAHEKELDSEKYRYEEFERINMGGDWTLTDHFGNKRSSTDFRGQWIIMYMGFTHCPDICPEEMEKLGKIVKTFDENSHLPKLQPLFITLDPERDTPSVIKDYLKDFYSPRIIGFTGTEDEIKQVAKKFRAYFGKGPKDVDNDYIVDHTIVIYLINPKGEFVNYYMRSRTAEEVIQSVSKHIAKYNELEKQ
ncbi:Protein sco2 mitochondrial [Bulinus truncatus]|nr:Protein sco2 mitochondrial [Bulinus truncatus]